MLEAACYFRGNFMNPQAAERLLHTLCVEPEMAPECWNIFEPIDIPFDRNKLDQVTSTLAARPDEGASGVFFVRKKIPRCLATIALRSVPVQWQTPHHSITLQIEDDWPEGDY